MIIRTFLFGFLGILLFFSQAEAIGSATRCFFDASRERPLITTLWYPEPFSPGKLYPLVAFSHDKESSRLELAWLAEFLAEQGFIVAAVDHFGDTGYLKLSSQQDLLWNRPLDITVLLKALSTDPQFGPHFKQDNVAILGYSVGSLTALWLAGAKPSKFPSKEGTYPYKDYRVRAVILLGPGFGSYFDRGDLQAMKIPVLIVAAENDTVYPLFGNAMYYSKFIPHAKYIKIHGNATHDVFLCPDRTQKTKLKKSILEFLRGSLNVQQR